MGLARGRLSALPLVVLAGVLAGCANTVGGQALPAAEPAPTSTPSASNDPCALLTPEHATRIGLRPEGKFSPAEPKRLVPPNCYFGANEDSETGDSLTVTFSSKIGIDEYFDGVAPAETLQLGGLAWKRYPSVMGGSTCSIAVELGRKSFVSLMSSNYGDESKACAAAKAAAPLVASHLPGGDPAPPPPPPPAPSALEGVEPCELLKPEQISELGLIPEPEKTGREADSDLPPGCQWNQTDGAKAQLYLSVSTDASAEELAYGEKPEREVEAGSRTWLLFEKPGGMERTCMMILPVDERSAVKMNSGNDDHAKACEQLLVAAPMISENLPK